MKTCPYCAESIQDLAIKCRYCHEWLEEAPRARNVKAEEAEKVEQVLPELSEKELTLIKKIESLEEADVPFLYRAMQKYFPETTIPEKIARDDLNKMCVALFRDYPKACEALLSIYQV